MWCAVEPHGTRRPVNVPTEPEALPQRPFVTSVLFALFFSSGLASLVYQTV